MSSSRCVEGLVKELTEVYEDRRKELSDWLEHKFKSVPLPAEDLVDDAFIAAIRKVHADLLEPDNGWCAWLKTAAWHDALDLEGSRWNHERVSFDAMVEAKGESSAAGHQRAVTAPTPATAAAEKERRGRQVKLLSDIFREFCRHCEMKPAMLKQKENLERFLRGQDNPKIAAAMGIPTEHVETAKSHAGSWLAERMRIRTYIALFF